MGIDAKSVDWFFSVPRVTHTGPCDCGKYLVKFCWDAVLGESGNILEWDWKGQPVETLES